MPHIIKVVTAPNPPNGFHNEFVEYVSKRDAIGVHLVREPFAAVTFPTFGLAMQTARLVQEDMPERTVTVEDEES